MSDSKTMSLDTMMSIYTQDPHSSRLQNVMPQGELLHLSMFKMLVHLGYIQDSTSWDEGDIDLKLAMDANGRVALVMDTQLTLDNHLFQCLHQLGYRDYSQAEFQGVIDFSDMDLSECYFHNSADCARFTDPPILAGAHLHDSLLWPLAYLEVFTLEDVNLRGCFFGGINVRDYWFYLICNRQLMRFLNCDLSNTSFGSLNLAAFDFSGIKPIESQMDLSGSKIMHQMPILYQKGQRNFCQVDFRQTELTSSIWDGCQLYGADFRGCDLTQCNMRTIASCIGIQLDGAHITSQQYMQLGRFSTGTCQPIQITDYELMDLLNKNVTDFTRYDLSYLSHPVDTNRMHFKSSKDGSFIFPAIPEGCQIRTIILTPKVLKWHNWHPERYQKVVFSGFKQHHWNQQSSDDNVVMLLKTCMQANCDVSFDACEIVLTPSDFAFLSQQNSFVKLNFKVDIRDMKYLSAQGGRQNAIYRAHFVARGANVRIQPSQAFTRDVLFYQCGFELDQGSIDMAHIQFSECYFSNVSFRRHALDASRFKACTFDRACTFKGAQLSKEFFSSRSPLHLMQQYQAASRQQRKDLARNQSLSAHAQCILRGYKDELNERSCGWLEHTLLSVKTTMFGKVAVASALAVRQDDSVKPEFKVKQLDIKPFSMLAPIKEEQEKPREKCFFSPL